MSDYILKDGTLYHHGIKGQKWGIRRFQNEDGSYTEEGKRRYYKNYYGYTGEIRNKKDYRNAVKGAKETLRYNKKFIDKNFDGSHKDKRDFKKAEKKIYKEGLKEIKDAYSQTSDYKARKIVKIGLAVAGTALAAYGGYKLYQFYKDNNTSIDEGKTILDKGLMVDSAKLSEISASNLTGGFDTIHEIHAKVNGTTPEYEKALSDARRNAVHDVAESIRKTGSHQLIEEAQGSSSLSRLKDIKNRRAELNDDLMNIMKRVSDPNLDTSKREAAKKHLLEVSNELKNLDKEWNSSYKNLSVRKDELQSDLDNIVNRIKAGNTKSMSSAKKMFDDKAKEFKLLDDLLNDSGSRMKSRNYHKVSYNEEAFNKFNNTMMAYEKMIKESDKRGDTARSNLLRKELNEMASKIFK